MFWTEEKIAARINELSSYRYRDSLELTSFLGQVDVEGNPGTRPPVGGEWEEFKLGQRWSGRDLYLWLQAAIDVPEEWVERRILGLFDFGRTGGGNNSGFESLLYLNGTPYQGVDSNHQEVFLPAEVAGSTVKLEFRLWSGLEGGGKPTLQEHILKRAAIAWLDEDADDLYFTSKAVLATTEVLPPDSFERQALLKALDRAFLNVNWSEPGAPAFYDSLGLARAELHAEIAKIERIHPVTVHTVGHTHIDVAWLWRLKHTREKAVRSFTTVLRLMEAFPEYIFLQTQPQLYDYMKSDYPEIYEQIRHRVQAGRWEAAGGMWLEADCNLTSGESLVRQLLLGTRFLEKEFGSTCTYLWLPDVFGYSWALPQILRKSGIDTFMTTKISWNQYNRMPHDTFVWRGIDGSEVLAHFITTPEVNSPSKWWYTYNGMVTPESVKGIWDAYRDKSVNQDLLLSYGYGDGGGGVNREMLEMRRRLEDLPGLPQVTTTRADDFFAQLHDTIKNTDQYVHTWDGELYLEYHRGTYTSQAYNKRMNRKLELLYRETEWLSALTSAVRSDFSSYPQQQLYDGWKIILRNQFHDIIPGSSIREVYQDSRVEYQQAEGLGLQAWTGAATSLTNHGIESGSYVVFNSAPWRRTDLVHLDATSEQSGVWTDAFGNELVAQRSDTGWWVLIADLPSMGFTTLHFQAAAQQEAPAPFTVMDSEIHTPYYQVKWNAEGQLVRLYDKTAKRDVLAKHQHGNSFQVFEDKPKRFEAWDIDLFYQEKMREIRQLDQVEVAEQGPLRVVVHFEWTYMNSTIKQNMILYANDPRIDFQTEVDWHERQQLLKVAFPVDIRATEATYDIQFGNVKRPTHWNTSWDQARFETVGHQWGDLSEQGYGVSLLNDCKYGHDIKDNVIRLSLIKSAIHPDVEADQGQHLFTYSLLPHQGGWYEGGTVQAAWNLNNPVTATLGSAQEKALSLFASNSDRVMIDAVKKAEDEDAVVLRVHDFSGGRGPVILTSDLSITSWQECDLLEHPIGDPSATSELHFNLDPYEIKTFLVYFH